MINGFIYSSNLDTTGKKVTSALRWYTQRPFISYHMRKMCYFWCVAIFLSHPPRRGLHYYTGTCASFWWLLAKRFGEWNALLQQPLGSGSNFCKKFWKYPGLGKLKIYLLFFVVQILVRNHINILVLGL